MTSQPSMIDLLHGISSTWCIYKGVDKGGGGWGFGGKKTKEGRSILLTKRDTPLRLTTTEAPPP